MDKFLAGMLVGVVCVVAVNASVTDTEKVNLKQNITAFQRELAVCRALMEQRQQQPQSGAPSTDRPTPSVTYTFPTDPRETPPVPPAPALNCVRQIAAARAQRDHAATVWAESVMCAKPECLRAVITSQAEFKDADDALRVLEAAQVAGRAPCTKE